MSKDSITPKMIAELEAEIRYHSRLYYDMNKPELSDDEFDVLFDRLQRWAPDSPVLNERAQDAFDADFTHVIPMGSQSKCKTPRDLLDKFMGYIVTATPKLDGAGLALHYDGGRLVLAVTRGRTETGKGKIITANAQEIQGIPKIIPFEKKVEIRGEVIILNSKFFGAMDQPGYDGLENGYANPRNAASGGLTCRDPRETKSRNLSFIPYKAMFEDSKSHNDQLWTLDSWGFSPLPFEIREITNMDDVEFLIQAGRRWKGMEEGVEGLDYNCDGIVIRIDNDILFEDKGMSGVCPNGSAAFKYQAVREETVLLDIEWVTNRTGIVHPTGVLEPVLIDGSMVGRATLNNPSWIKQFDGLEIGARVEVEKANDIIPTIVDVVVIGDGGTKQPTECPSCGAKLGYELKEDGTDGVRLRCPNKVDCPAQFRDSILHMLKKLEIKNIAEATLDRIIKAGLVYHPWDMFTLDAGELESAGFKKREGEVVLEALADVEASPANILAAVGVDFWGKRMVGLLLKNGSPIYTEEKVLSGDFDYDELAGVNGVGPAKARALSEAFGSVRSSSSCGCDSSFSLSDENRSSTSCNSSSSSWASLFLKELLKKVKVIKKEVGMSGKGNSKVAGMSFCLSGTMPRGKKQIEADVTAKGGTIKSGVSAKLDFLVAGEGSGSKSAKAEAAGVAIITEDELYEMLGE